MPVYDFRCEICEEKVIDKLVKDWKENVACPACGAEMVKMIPSEMRVHFKGWWPGESLKKKEEK